MHGILVVALPIITLMQHEEGYASGEDRCEVH